MTAKTIEVGLVLDVDADHDRAEWWPELTYAEEPDTPWRDYTASAAWDLVDALWKKLPPGKRFRITVEPLP